jgi:hypothetical protein
MKKRTIISILAAVIDLSAATVLAQTSAAGGSLAGEGKVFGGISVGGQFPSRTFDAVATTPVYDQTASLATTTGVDSGPIFDVNGGYRLTRRYGVGAGFTSFGVTGSTLGSASVPNPSFRNQPATVAVPAMDAKRSEYGVYLQFVYFYPITDKIEVDAFAGPSFIHVRQDVVADFTVPAGTQDVIPSLQKQSGTAFGGIIGVDGSYFLTKQIAAGGFMRFNGGSVDLTSADNVKAGGFQIGVGIRVRY